MFSEEVLNANNFDKWYFTTNYLAGEYELKRWRLSSHLAAAPAEYTLYKCTLRLPNLSEIYFCRKTTNQRPFIDEQRTNNEKSIFSLLGSK